MKEKIEETVRPLAFQLARELNEKEVEAIAGAGVSYTYPPPGHQNDPNWRDWHD